MTVSASSIRHRRLFGGAAALTVPLESTNRNERAHSVILMDHSRAQPEHGFCASAAKVRRKCEGNLSHASGGSGGPAGLLPKMRNGV